MSKQKNIAFLVYDTSLTGGAEVITKQLANELNKTDNVIIISLFQKNEIEHKGYEHQYLYKEAKSIPLNLFKLAKGVRKILLEREINVLFSVTAGVNSIAIQAAKRTATKVVYIEHSNLMNQTYGKKHYYRQRLGALYAQQVVTLTERDKNNYIKQFHMQPSSITVIPNWFENVVGTSNYDIQSKKIISVGRLVPLKGYDSVLEVAKIIFKKHPDWVWDIYGDGPQHQYLAEKIKEFKLECNVYLKGNVSNITELYHEYAFFVLCSRFEGIPLVMLEAQSAGLPIVSYDCQTGPREIILDKINGNLVEEQNVEDMVVSILYMIEHPDVRKEYSLHAMDNMDQFRKEVVLKKWKDLIETLD